LVGGAWWQWKQACGDPHSIGTPGGHPPSQTDSLVRLACPSDAPVGIAAPFQRILGRAYPRAAAGTLRSLASDPATGDLEVTGASGAQNGTVDIWAPAAETAPPVVSGTNIGGVEVAAVPGGYRVTVKVTGSYAVSITR
jgi:endoglycosylceramidase